MDVAVARRRLAEEINKFVVRLVQLVEELKIASESFKMSPRVGSMLAMDAVTDYFLETGFHPKLLLPLLEMRCALEDAIGGRSNPLTKPEKHGGGPKTNDTKTANRVLCSAMVTILMDAGRPLESALSDLAKAAGAKDPKAFTKKLNTYRNNLLSALRSVKVVRGRSVSQTGHRIPPDALPLYDKVLSDVRALPENARTRFALAIVTDLITRPVW
jgi:hypothetical protein